MLYRRLELSPHHRSVLHVWRTLSWSLPPETVFLFLCTKRPAHIRFMQSFKRNTKPHLFPQSAVSPIESTLISSAPRYFCDNYFLLVLVFVLVFFFFILISKKLFVVFRVLGIVLLTRFSAFHIFYYHHYYFFIIIIIIVMIIIIIIIIITRR